MICLQQEVEEEDLSAGGYFKASATFLDLISTDHTRSRSIIPIILDGGESNFGDDEEIVVLICVCVSYQFL